jgi:hypothetical protein
MRHGSFSSNYKLHDVASWYLLANLQKNDPQRPSVSNDYRPYHKLALLLTHLHYAPQTIKLITPSW